MHAVVLPVRTEVSNVEDPPLLVSVDDVATHLGVISAGGTLDDASKTVIEDLLFWATERCASYLGVTLNVSTVWDYYGSLGAGVYQLSSSADLDPSAKGDDAPRAEYWPEGGTDYVTLDADLWVLDDTASPPQVRVDGTVPGTTAQRQNPFRVVYQVAPYQHEKPLFRQGHHLIVGTIVDLVGLRWVSRGQPPSFAAHSAVERILGANLR